MRSATLAAVILCLGAAAMGCSADGSSGDDTSGEAGSEGGKVDSSTPDATAQDSAAGADGQVPKFDSGTVDTGAAVDSGSEAEALDGGSDSAAIFDSGADVSAEAGSSCSPSGTVQSEPCGACGTQTRTCSGTPSVWGAWGTCSGQLPNGCTPGATSMSACGFCGTMTLVCQTDCQYAASACTGQVANGCYSASSEFTPDPTCGDGGVEGKGKTCLTGCMWSAVTACEAPPTTLTVPAALGSMGNTIVNLGPTKIARLVPGNACPATVDTAVTPYEYVVLTNSTAQKAVVSIWTDATSATTATDIEMTTYPGATPPANANARQACTNTVNDYCFDFSGSDFLGGTSCAGSFGGLMLGDANAVTIAAGASVVIYVAGATAADTGPVNLVVRTESLM